MCNGLTLSEPQKSTSPLYLQVFALGKEYDIEFVQASNHHFWVGGGPKTYCPDEDEARTECGSDTNTVFYSNSLSVSTPGGQRIFIQEEGTLAFTVAHSALEPDMAHDGENVAYSFSGYFGPDGSHWDACRPRGSYDRRRTFADLAGVDLTTEDCEGIFLYVNNDLPDSECIAMRHLTHADSLKMRGVSTNTIDSCQELRTNRGAAVMGNDALGGLRGSSCSKECSGRSEKSGRKNKKPAPRASDL